MAKKNVIAFFLHEDEQAAAIDALTEAESTDSFVIGEIDDDKIEALRRRGLIIQELDESELPRVGQMVVAATGKHLAYRETEAEHFDRTVPNYYRVNLKGPLLEKRRAELESHGFHLQESVAPNAYIGRMDSNQAADLRSLSFVRSVRPQTDFDVNPVVSVRASPPAQTTGARMVTYDVRLHRADGMSMVMDWLGSRGIDVAGRSRRKVRVYLMENSPDLEALAALPEVQTVDKFVPPSLTNDRARALTRIENANPGASIPLTGRGQIIGVADTGLDDLHPDFQGRIVGLEALGRQGNSSDPHGHGTHVAGTALGDGSGSGGQLHGMAPEADLYFQSIMDASGGLGGLPVDLNDLFDQAYRNGVRIHNNSWGADTASRYTVNSVEVDEFVAAHPDMLIVISAGNEGVGSGAPGSPGNTPLGFVDWLSIGSPASAKNALTVGASRSDRTQGGLSSLTWQQAWPGDFPDPPIANEQISGDPEALAAFSSRGPCDDGRIKPDLVAPGTDIASAKSSIAPLRNFWGPVPGHGGRYAYNGGTSMAAPVVSGCAALVRQFYVDNGHAPSAALLKATLINGCRWLSGQDSIADFAKEPNFHQGFGGIDLTQTIPNPAEPGLALEYLDDWQNPGQGFTFTGQRMRYRIAVASALPLRICLVWTDLPARALQNNLNLQAQSQSTGQRWLGNADLPMSLNIPDPDNNVEVIEITTPPAGDFLVQVNATNLLDTSGQAFALVITGDLQGSLGPF